MKGPATLGVDVWLGEWSGEIGLFKYMYIRFSTAPTKKKEEKKEGFVYIYFLQT